jgi:hypothetical protein
MRHSGSPAEWQELLDSLVPDILALVIATWEGMPQPAVDALEDPISVTLCLHLRQGRDRCDLPFNVYTQLVELDPTAGQEQGRMDIVFAPMVPRENIYFCLECKRLNVTDGERIRPYSSEYVRFGLMRFVTGQYSATVRNGGMLGYVLDGNVVSATANIEKNLHARRTELGMDSPGRFFTSGILPADTRVRETRHRRPNTGVPIIIHHLFMPRTPQPNAPSSPPKPSTQPPQPARRKKPGRKKN